MKMKQIFLVIAEGGGVEYTVCAYPFLSAANTRIRELAKNAQRVGSGMRYQVEIVDLVED